MNIFFNSILPQALRNAWALTLASSAIFHGVLVLFGAPLLRLFDLVLGFASQYNFCIKPLVADLSSSAFFVYSRHLYARLHLWTTHAVF